jgi:hypothetical protein
MEASRFTEMSVPVSRLSFHIPEDFHLNERRYKARNQTFLRLVLFKFFITEVLIQLQSQKAVQNVGGHCWRLESRLFEDAVPTAVLDQSLHAVLQCSVDTLRLMQT